MALDANSEDTLSGYEVGIRQPKFDKNGKLVKGWTAIKDADHALSVCESTRSQNVPRAGRCAAIQRHYDGEAPYELDALKKHKQDWRNNASSLSMATVVDRAVMQMIDAVNQLPFITNSSLPQMQMGWMQKSALFQEVTTRVVRAWPGWADYLQGIAQENGLQGYVFGSWPELNDWRPKLYKAERAFVPNETPQHADKVQVICVQEDFLVNEFMDLWYEDQDVAEDLGWNIDNCYESAANAVYKNRAGEMRTYNPRALVDSIRDSAIGYAFASPQGPLVVQVWNIFVIEYDGSVSQWMISRDGYGNTPKKPGTTGGPSSPGAKDGPVPQVKLKPGGEGTRPDVELPEGKLLYKAISKHKRMSDCLAVYSYETGDLTLHGSKGLGRKLVNLTRPFEKYFNLFLDQLFISGFVIVQTDGKSRDRVQQALHYPFVVISSAWQVSPQTFPNTAQALQEALTMLQLQIERIAGVYISIAPEDQSSSRKTKGQVQAEMVKETQTMSWVMSRWLQFIFWGIKPMQLRLYHDDVIKEAVRIISDIPLGEHMDELERIIDKGLVDREALMATYELLMRGLTPDDLKYLRERDPSLVTNKDADAKKQGYAQVTQIYGQSPLINQYELTKRNLEALIGKEGAAAILLVSNDAAEVAENTTKQQGECINIMAGFDAPVSERDNHLVHMQTILQAQQEMSILHVPPNQKAIDTAENGLKHFMAHLQLFAGKAAGNPQAQMQVQQFAKVVQAAQAAIASAQQQLKVMTAVAKGLASLAPANPQGVPQGSILPLPTATGAPNAPAPSGPPPAQVPPPPPGGATPPIPQSLPPGIPGAGGLNPAVPGQ